MTEGRGAVQTLGPEGSDTTPLEPGALVWFTPAPSTVSSTRAGCASSSSCRTTGCPRPGTPFSPSRRSTSPTRRPTRAPYGSRTRPRPNRPPWPATAAISRSRVSPCCARRGRRGTRSPCSNSSGPPPGSYGTGCRTGGPAGRRGRPRRPGIPVPSLTGSRRATTHISPRHGCTPDSRPRTASRHVRTARHVRRGRLGRRSGQGSWAAISTAAAISLAAAARSGRGVPAGPCRTHPEGDQLVYASSSESCAAGQPVLAVNVSRR